ncbi:LysR family transcriptional regulator, glycine cleavage system transcriptional activator/LysR family transcriptional regulator, regulator of gene expression of beta-lactamase [Paracoccus isoporae]|uniref:LysR family transcriptional regulator, glycine cleavage system transcriptional activator/LysR family transcriptional regulator, regulator of gene expression of beta-lactamase n=1 Tax=Paracoccus isoporae TaxID=591205 RepID=A0A1G7H017_9RHOB|nr:LysR substrate-binding domain-containing protein [Paracoccus isoporae]SDE93760.1 LysR family transcriptional regulator, glycine cleavage system transcriptional activator/LysR family transcriptional regulator, regulator of gene expression of beta-lactamase [Paracoccus isoporae]
MNGKLRLPPLNALRAFHAVARHKSLRQAADELYVTPQAVGQQIKLLEDALQVKLFERKGRSIEPTESAVLLAHYVEAGFSEFAEGVRRITRSPYRDRINLNTSPYFATNYLLRHLSEFREEMPSLDLRLTTMIDMPDFARDDVDMTVQWGYGHWSDVECTLLVRDPKVICCTAQIAATLRKPADLLDCTLLDTVKSKHLWTDIFRHLGVEPGEQHGSIGFDDAASMRRATLQGIGVGLLSPHDAHADMRSGELVAPLGRDILDDMPDDQVPGFYLLVPRGHLRVQGVAALHRWMVSQDWGRDLIRKDHATNRG